MSRNVAQAVHQIVSERLSIFATASHRCNGDRQDNTDADQGSDNVDPEGRNQATPAVDRARDHRRQQCHRRVNCLINAVYAHELTGRGQLW